MNQKYVIVSPTLGWYLGFYEDKHVFSLKRPNIQNDFVSAAGAEAMLDLMPSLGDTPEDCMVVPLLDRQNSTESDYCVSS